MRAGVALAWALSVVPFVSAHNEGGIPGAPKIFGRRSAGKFQHGGSYLEKEWSAPVEHVRPHHPHFEAHQHMNTQEKRQNTQNTDGQCGPGVGSCATGYCCSPAGWCGKGEAYCAAPGAQFHYGSGADANATPPGTNTSSIARTKSGSVPYGGDGIYECTVNGLVALTFDDGPYIYTSAMLDVLDKYNVKATFFITGNNLGKGEIDNTAYPWAALIQRMYAAGHQIASHTWSHQDLSNEVNKPERFNQMYKNEMALRNILGVFPTYMRPPYSSCTSASGCPADMATMGYHITYFDLDTEDYLNPTPAQIQTAKNDFSGNISTNTPSTGAWLTVAHDIQQQTATNLTEFMVQTGLAAGWKFGTVGECMGDPKANWYRSSSGSTFSSASSAIPSSTAAASATSAVTGPLATIVSTDASCGATANRTCLGSAFGNCCSTNGWCGSTTDYCGTGCQAGYGNCGSNGASVVSSSASAAATVVSAASLNLTVSVDASCGGTTGYTCQGSEFGNCCSVNGWCGSTTDYCGTGCQIDFGSCGSSANVVSSTVSGPVSASVPVSVNTGLASSVARSASASSSSVVSSASSSAATASSSTAASSVASSSIASSLSSSTSSAPAGAVSVSIGGVVVGGSSSIASSSVAPSSMSSTSIASSSISPSSIVPSSSVAPSSVASSSVISPSVASSSIAASSVVSSSVASSAIAPSIVSSASSAASSPSSSQAPSSAASSSAPASSIPSSTTPSSTVKPSSSSSSVASSSSSSASSSSSSSKASSSSSSATKSSSSSSSLKPSSTTSTAPSSTVSVLAGLKASTNGRCGSTYKSYCEQFSLTPCCGSNGYCGVGLSCFKIFGCQAGYGTCM